MFRRRDLSVPCGGQRTPWRPGQLHICCYCLSPIRYARDLHDRYLAQVKLSAGPGAWGARHVFDRIAAWDRRVSAWVDRFVAISEHIRQRIRRCYDRDADVIYPPVTLPLSILHRAGEHAT